MIMTTPGAATMNPWLARENPCSMAYSGKRMAAPIVKP